MTRIQIGYTVWGTIATFALITELLSVLDKRTPWPTLSGTVTHLAKTSPWLTMLLAAALFLLALHWIFYPWPNLPK